MKTLLFVVLIFKVALNISMQSSFESHACEAWEKSGRNFEKKEKLFSTKNLAKEKKDLYLNVTWSSFPIRNAIDASSSALSLLIDNSELNVIRRIKERKKIFRLKVIQLPFETSNNRFKL